MAGDPIQAHNSSGYESPAGLTAEPVVFAVVDGELTVLLVRRIHEPFQGMWDSLTLAADPAEPGQLERSRLATEVGDYRRFYASVRDAIRGEAPLVISAEDGYRAIRLLELAVQSSDQNHTLAVDFAE